MREQRKKERDIDIYRDREITIEPERNKGKSIISIFNIISFLI